MCPKHSKLHATPSPPPSRVVHAAGSGSPQRADHGLQLPSSAAQQLIAEADSGELRRIIIAAASHLESYARR